MPPHFSRDAQVFKFTDQGGQQSCRDTEEFPKGLPECLFFSSHLFLIGRRRPSQSPAVCSNHPQDAQSQQGNEGVPGDEMKEHWGSSGSTVGRSNLEIRAGRDRIWHFGLARAGREQRGNVTRGLLR